jgi:hypothetical protein
MPSMTRRKPQPHGIVPRSDRRCRVGPTISEQSSTIRAKNSAEKELPTHMKRIRQLDGVRGLAVLAVFVHNTDIYPSLHLGVIVSNG